MLYNDKDYAGEVAYIDQLIKKYNPKAQSVLDFGCGTCKHDFLLIDEGYAVTRVDMSEVMLAEAHGGFNPSSFQSFNSLFPIPLLSTKLCAVCLNPTLMLL